mgnify:CR=1 FL=1
MNGVPDACTRHFRSAIKKFQVRKKGNFGAEQVTKRGGGDIPSLHSKFKSFKANHLGSIES